MMVKFWKSINLMGFIQVCSVWSIQTHPKSLGWCRGLRTISKIVGCRFWPWTYQHGILWPQIGWFRTKIDQASKGFHWESAGGRPWLGRIFVPGPWRFIRSSSVFVSGDSRSWRASCTAPALEGPTQFSWSTYLRCSLARHGAFGAAGSTVHPASSIGLMVCWTLGPYWRPIHLPCTAKTAGSLPRTLGLPCTLLHRAWPFGPGRQGWAMCS